MNEKNQVLDYASPAVRPRMTHLFFPATIASFSIASVVSFGLVVLVFGMEFKLQILLAVAVTLTAILLITVAIVRTFDTGPRRTAVAAGVIVGGGLGFSMVGAFSIYLMNQIN